MKLPLAAAVAAALALGAPLASAQQAPPPPPPAWGSMQAGGLAPPPPIGAPSAPPPAASPTAEQLAAAKQKDSRRGLEWVWIEVEGGYEHAILSTFGTAEPALTSGLLPKTANAGLVGAGLFAKLLFFTLGARGRASFSSAWKRYSIGGEAGVHFPVGLFEPHVALGGGYTTFADLHGAAADEVMDRLHLRGFYLRVTGGLDVFVARVFSIGLNLGWELLGLQRPALSPADVQALRPRSVPAVRETAATRLARDASSWGSAVSVTAAASLHF
jgi:hypothetical protein